MELNFAKRMDTFQPGIFNVLNDRKDALVKQGKKVYNLSIGTPDFPPAPHVMQALVEAAARPENYKYSIHELPELIEAVQGWYRRRYGVALGADQILSVYGSQEGLAHIGLALCDPGDVVLVPDPGYPIFEIGPWLCGAAIETYPLLPENGYLIDFDSIDPAVAEKAKFMVVSYPMNPVCAAAPREFYERLVAFANCYHIMILHDNAYSDIIYDGREGISFLSIPGAMDVGVEFNSLSKTYNLTGARISFVLGNADIIAAFRKVRSQIDYGIFYPVQYAAIAALNGPQDGVKAQCMEYQRRRDTLCGGFRRIGWNVPDSQGSMFVWAPIPEEYPDAETFCFDLLEKTGVICTPGSAFGSLGKRFVRMALVLPVETLEELVAVVEKSGIFFKK